MLAQNWFVHPAQTILFDVLVQKNPPSICDISENGFTLCGGILIALIHSLRLIGG